MVNEPQSGSTNARIRINEMVNESRSGSMNLSE
jgi:hypothetical protein